MKRTIKILTATVIVATLFGIAAILSSANEVSGVHLTELATFESLDPVFTLTTSGKDQAVEGYAWTLKNRSGTVSVGLSDDTADSPNQYILIHNAPGVASSDPYWGTGYGGVNTSNLENKATRPLITDGNLDLMGTDVTNWPYLVMDLDVMSPTAKWNSSTSLELRSFLAGDTTLDSVRAGDDVSSPINFGTDSTGCYISNNSGSYKKYVNPFEFTHVTLIFEAVADGSFRSANLYVYINGEFAYAHEGKNVAGTNGEAAYYAGTPHLSFDEIRFHWAHSNDESISIGIDNIATRLIDTTYTGNLPTVLSAKTDILSWDANLYDSESMPFGKAVCDVSGVKYESLEKAFEAAAEGSTVTLFCDVPTEITVNKPITVKYGEFNARKIRTGEGLVIDASVDGEYNIIFAEGKTTTLTWDDCHHEPKCTDNFNQNHPLHYVKEDVVINKKILSVYDPTYIGYIGNDGILYNLVGWTNAASGVMIDATTTVTDYDIKNGGISLAPLYEKVPVNFEYTVNGIAELAKNNEMTLAEVIAAADAGTTVKLMSDIHYRNLATSIDIGKEITLDLNGYTIIATREGSKAKTSLFRLTTGTDFTVMSSRPGAKIFNEGWNGNTSVGAAGVFNAPNNTSILRINGNGENGKPNLAVYSGTIIEAYSNALEYHIDGGMFIAVTGDQQGLLDVRCAGRDVTIKNAIFYAPHSILSFAGRNYPVNDECNVTVDNCVFIGDLTTTLVKPVVVTVTNSYIYGNIKPALNAYPTIAYSETNQKLETPIANVPGTVILGDGNYVKGSWNEYVIFEEGVEVYNNTFSKNITYALNSWKASATHKFDDSSFIAKEVSEDFTFNYLISKEAPKNVKLIWKDANGNIIGESEGAVGSKAVAPDNLKATGEIIPGWLDYVPAEWNESLIIPDGVSEYIITAKEDGAITPVMAVDLYFNITLTTHFEYHMFIPEIPEGIEITAVSFRGDRLSRYNSLKNTKYKIAGNIYTMVDAWPGLANAVGEDSSAGITFTYNGVSYKAYRTINMVDYCNYILDAKDEAGQPLYNEESKNLAANTANYLHKGLIMLGKENLAEKVLDIVENNKERIYSLDKDNLPTVDLSAISDYVSSVELTIFDYGPRFRFNLTDVGMASKVSLSTGAQSSSSSNYVTLGYIETNNTNISSINNTVITITPPIVDGVMLDKISFTFTLADYYAAMQKAEVDPTILATVDAMYGYALANSLY